MHSNPYASPSDARSDAAHTCRASMQWLYVTELKYYTVGNRSSFTTLSLGLQSSASVSNALRAAQDSGAAPAACRRASLARRREDRCGSYQSMPERSALDACSMRDASWPMLGHEPYGCRRAHSLSRLAAVCASPGPSGRRSFRLAPRGVPWAPHGRKNRCAIDA